MLTRDSDTKNSWFSSFLSKPSQICNIGRDTQMLIEYCCGYVGVVLLPDITTGVGGLRYIMQIKFSFLLSFFSERTDEKPLIA